MTTWTVTDLARRVRTGELDPVDLVERALARILAAGGDFGAFRRVRADEARAEARSLSRRTDLAQLVLAGVPIAIKDVTAVAGEYHGFPDSSGRQFDSDSDIVQRLRAAGAVIVGLTRTPELCLWPMTDTVEAVVQNPWAPAFTAGGSSGGSAAAVAAGFVPAAHGTDAFGSLRSPAAICGLVAITPGTGTVRSWDSGEWSGMYTHGPLTTTVSDAALVLSVLAERPELAQLSGPRTLRIATSVRPPNGRRQIPQEFASAVSRTGELLALAGHHVSEATPHYGNITASMLTRWLAGPGAPGDQLNRRGLEPRTRTHLRAAQLVRRTGLVRQRARREWIGRAERFFGEHDVLITPMLATMPPAAKRWGQKSWLANALTAIRLTPFLGPWDLAGYPTMSIPAARHPSGLPIGVQLVAPPGGETRLLALGTQLEALNAWPRTTVA